VFQRLDPTTWHEGTAHPNDLGHRCETVVVADWILNRSGLGLAAPGPVPVPVGCELPTADQVAAQQAAIEAARRADPLLDVARTDLLLARPGEPADGLPCVRDPDGPDDEPTCFDGKAWIRSSIGGPAARVSLFLGVLLLGGMLLALATARLRPPYLDFLLPSAPVGSPSSPSDPDRSSGPLVTIAHTSAGARAAPGAGWSAMRARLPR
jgi:hypothetical protein